MPIPSPSSSEKSSPDGKNKYIGRCMDFLKDENKPQNQKVAICESTYKRSKQKKVVKGSNEEPTWDEEVINGVVLLEDGV